MNTLKDFWQVQRNQSWPTDLEIKTQWFAYGNWDKFQYELAALKKKLNKVGLSTEVVVQELEDQLDVMPNHEPIPVDVQTKQKSRSVLKKLGNFAKSVLLIAGVLGGGLYVAQPGSLSSALPPGSSTLSTLPSGNVSQAQFSKVYSFPDAKGFNLFNTSPDGNVTTTYKKPEGLFSAPGFPTKDVPLDNFPEVYSFPEAQGSQIFNKTPSYKPPTGNNTFVFTQIPSTQLVPSSIEPTSQLAGQLQPPSAPSALMIGQPPSKPLMISPPEPTLMIREPPLKTSVRQNKPRPFQLPSAPETLMISPPGRTLELPAPETTLMIGAPPLKTSVRQNKPRPRQLPSPDYEPQLMLPPAIGFTPYGKSTYLPMTPNIFQYPDFEYELQGFLPEGEKAFNPQRPSRGLELFFMRLRDNPEDITSAQFNELARVEDTTNRYLEHIHSQGLVGSNNVSFQIKFNIDDSGKPYLNTLHVPQSGLVKAKNASEIIKENRQIYKAFRQAEKRLSDQLEKRRLRKEQDEFKPPKTQASYSSLKTIKLQDFFMNKLRSEGQTPESIAVEFKQIAPLQKAVEKFMKSMHEQGFVCKGILTNHLEFAVDDEGQIVLETVRVPSERLWNGDIIFQSEMEKEIRRTSQFFEELKDDFRYKWQKATRDSQRQRPKPIASPQVNEPIKVVKITNIEKVAKPVEVDVPGPTSPEPQKQETSSSNSELLIPDRPKMTRYFTDYLKHSKSNGFRSSKPYDTLETFASWILQPTSDQTEAKHKLLVWNELVQNVEGLVSQFHRKQGKLLGMTDLQILKQLIKWNVDDKGYPVLSTMILDINPNSASYDPSNDATIELEEKQIKENLDEVKFVLRDQWVKNLKPYT